MGAVPPPIRKAPCNFHLHTSLSHKHLEGIFQDIHSIILQNVNKTGPDEFSIQIDIQDQSLKTDLQIMGPWNCDVQYGSHMPHMD